MAAPIATCACPEPARDFSPPIPMMRGGLALSEAEGQEEILPPPRLVGALALPPPATSFRTRLLTLAAEFESLEAENRRLHALLAATRGDTAPASPSQTYRAPLPPSARAPLLPAGLDRRADAAGGGGRTANREPQRRRHSGQAQGGGKAAAKPGNGLACGGAHAKNGEHQIVLEILQESGGEELGRTMSHRDMMYEMEARDGGGEGSARTSRVSGRSSRISGAGREGQEDNESETHYVNDNDTLNHSVKSGAECDNLESCERRVSNASAQPYQERETGTTDATVEQGQEDPQESKASFLRKHFWKQATKNDVNRTVDKAVKLPPPKPYMGHRKSLARANSRAEKYKDRGRVATAHTRDEIIDDHFANIKVALEEGCLDIDELYTFTFKKRETVGHAIHLVSLCPRGYELVDPLVRLRADVNDDAAGSSSTQQLRPVHFAAGAGDATMIQTLVSHGADVNALTSAGGLPHYMAIHEAAYHGNAEAVRCLLDYEADPDAVNKGGQTALHIAARVGSLPVIQILVEGNADVGMRCNDGHTALMDAAGSQFPDSELHLLARSCVEDLRDVAMQEQAAALILLRDRKWCRFLREPDHFLSVSELIEILREAPSVAAELLRVLTLEPYVLDPFRYPLPRQVVRDAFSPLRCAYAPDYEWGEAAWHDQLVAKAGLEYFRGSDFALGFWDGWARFLDLPRGKARAQFRVLRLSGILCETLLFTINELPGHAQMAMMSEIYMQAILDNMWQMLLCNYMMHFLWKVLELVTLVWITYEWEFFQQSDTIWWRATWSILATASLRDVAMELLSWRGFWVNFSVHQRSSCALDIVSVVLTAMFATQSALLLSFDMPRLLAVVSFIRWVHLLYMMRAFKCMRIGMKILPIVRSFFQVGGILAVTIVVFIAFVHMFCALDRGKSVNEVILGAFKLLFLGGEDDGIAFVLTLGQEEGRAFNVLEQEVANVLLYFAVFIFCICILNLFIAVHGEAYNAVAMQVTQQFYLERLQICLDGFLQPRWTRRLPLAPWKCGFLLMCPTLCAWSALLLVEPLHPMLASAFLALVTLFCDAMLKKRPYEEMCAQIGPDRRTIFFDKDNPKRLNIITQMHGRPKHNMYCWWVTWDES
eukprot:TRINITY_DN19983_c0_g1_i1.p1 TRINITY_DN19983_c0_g1~~TRINITY_DN19983_c0_g1_i1.p1  ORF type:complete len:1113 (-),score=201.50 TRINITY_DN19983_c0_g1_i1:351-3689(-)